MIISLSFPYQELTFKTLDKLNSLIIHHLDLYQYISKLMLNSLIIHHLDLYQYISKLMLNDVLNMSKLVSSDYVTYYGMHYRSSWHNLSKLFQSTILHNIILFSQNMKRCFFKVERFFSSEIQSFISFFFKSLLIVIA